MGRPLDGVRILDMTIWQQGTHATALLADLGADVIKIEGPDNPDPGRGVGFMRPPGSLNGYFETHNRGKRAIALDVKHPEGRALLLRLAKDADVFTNNMRKGVLERLGLAYADFRAVNPRIIYAVASGYGDEGPERTLPSMDIMAQARGGVMGVTGEPDVPPTLLPAAVADQVGSYFLAHGILAALYMRERTGEGQQIDSSLLGAQIDFQSHLLQSYLFSGVLPQRRTRAQGQPLWNTYRGSDGRWFVIGLSQAGRWWPQLVQVLGIEDWEADPRFATHQDRMAHAPELIAKFDELFATRPRDYWVELLSRHQLMAARVQDYAEVEGDPQVVANRYIVEIERPDGRRVKMVNHPVRFGAAPEVGVRGAAPEFGQHTEEVLLEAGLTWEEITALREKGVIGARAAAEASRAGS
jgi:crotonobetainyl-CoA:carnitine CoA-transferase CaiB-like acyl-CoA transferase